MGSILYDFLANSFLFDDSRIATNYSDVTDEQLQHETAEYLSFSLAHASELYKESRRTRAIWWSCPTNP